MRAISLKMTAFGPYRDKQIIDFNDLGEESIFLITGPTGAGKTTIFDAMCYALYGRASGSDRDQDSLRSHFATVDHMTEVVFTFGLKGRTYRVSRYPKQQKRKERGEGFTEDPARAELYEINENDELILISSKIKDVNETLEEMLGLDYEQFRKMIMIPQGEFRKLVSENSKEREEILQKIFRTHFYQRITDELKKQSKELKEMIQQVEWKMEQETGKIQWKFNELNESETVEEIVEKLSEEQEKEKQQIKRYNEMLEKEKKKLNQAHEFYYNGKQLAEKFDELVNLNKLEKELEERLPQINKSKQELDLAKKAATIIPFEEQANSRKQEWQEQINKVKTQQNTIEQLNEKFESINKKYQEELEQEKNREQLKESIQSQQRQLEKLTQYVDLKNQFIRVEEESKGIKNELTKIQKEFDQFTIELEKIDQLVSEQNKWTKDYYEIEAKVKQKSEKLEKLVRLQKENHNLRSLRVNFQEVSNQYKNKQTELSEKRLHVQQLEDELKMNQAFILAQHLHDGEACPVCGSMEHPNKATEKKAVVSSEKIKEQKQYLLKMEQEFQKWQDKYVQVKSDGQAQRRLVEEMQEEFKDHLTDLEDEALEKLISERKQEQQNLLKEHRELKSHLAGIEQASQKRTKIQNDKKAKESHIDRKKQELEKVNGERIKLNTQIEQMEQEHTVKDLNPEQLQRMINQQQTRYETWMKIWEQVQVEYEETKNKRQQAVTVQEQLQSFLQNMKQRYEEQWELLNEKITDSGFSSLDTYKDAKLTDAQQQNIQQEINDFEQRRSNVLERIKDLEEQVNEKEKPNLVELRENVEKQEGTVEHLNQAIQEQVIHMKQHEQVKKVLEKLEEEYKNLTKQYYDIGELADLARGENHLRLSFERYVLSSFLDEILLQANIRMDQLTEHRYQLIRSDQVAKRGAQSGLDLEVLDHHTGQQRSVKTLSGGEGFKAALSLALGMADVVQAHAGGVQLETLFIDEGFGTLDELSLEQAIECLKGLQQSNRILGIISHVPQLKEEIHAKLQIIPSPQGSSAMFTI